MGNGSNRYAVTHVDQWNGDNHLTRSHCPKCDENSLIRKAYTAKQAPTERRVVEYCTNSGCGYSLAWRVPEAGMPETDGQETTETRILK